MTTSRNNSLEGEALAFVHAGSEQLAVTRFGQTVPKLELRSAWFADGAPLPDRCSADDEGVPPPLTWTEPPPRTREFALVCEDPDAPRAEPFVHWLVYGIPASARALSAENARADREGLNSAQAYGFTPAAPPPGHGIHHYHFQLFALDETLELAAGASKSELLDAMEGHVLAYGELVGTYLRG